MPPTALAHTGKEVLQINLQINFTIQLKENSQSAGCQKACCCSLSSVNVTSNVKRKRETCDVHVVHFNSGTKRNSVHSSVC